MRGADEQTGALFSYLSPDAMVPKDHPDPPPSEWSALRYGFEPEEDRDGEQEAPA